MSPVFGHGRLRLYILKLLDESPRHGYEIIKGLEERFSGSYSPSAGTVYPRLARLEEEGLVTHVEEDGRKVYRITSAGRDELAARETDLDDLEDEIAGSVRDLARQIRGEVHGSVKGLREQLKAAARSMRQEAKSRKHERHESIAEVDKMARRFREDLRDLARQAAPGKDEIRELEQVIQTAIGEARRVLRL